MDSQYYTSLVENFLKGRKVILIGAVLGSATPQVKQLCEFGAQRPFVLASSRGTGELPSSDDCEMFVLPEIPASESTFMESFRFSENLLGDLPADAVAAIDAWDPNREAICLGNPFCEFPTVAGRPVFGGRKSSWVVFEDKIMIDAVWDAAGIERAPSQNIAATDFDELRKARTKLDEGLGVVLAGDSREGMNGGAEYIRWIRREEDFAEAESFFGAHCNEVRMMPFLEGIPCSIHGIVLENDDIILRPVEMLTFKVGESSKLKYAGCSTRWDPKDADREAMREVARKACKYLRNAVDYRGAFTIDGIMSERGFLPTEMNPRFGAGIGTMAKSIPDIPLKLIETLIKADVNIDFHPKELETLILERVDTNRALTTWTSFSRDDIPEGKHFARSVDNSFALVSEEDDHDLKLVLGESPLGGFVRCELLDTEVNKGKPFAHDAARILEFTNTEFGTGLGGLMPAQHVR